jgi:hypothetical protein
MDSGISDRPRSEEEIFSGAVTVILGGVSKSMRPLVVTENEAWQQQLEDTAKGKLRIVATDWQRSVATFAGMNREQVALLVAYDLEGRLGGEEWILKHATSREVWEAFKRVFWESYPAFDDARRFPGIIGELLSNAPSLLARYGSEPSPSGDEPDASSRTPGPRSS